MIRMNLSDLTRCAEGRLLGSDAPFQGVSCDTRTLEPGNLFVALPGEHADGLDYIAQAEERGAAGALVARPVEAGIPLVEVTNPLVALGRMAAHWRDRMPARVVAITGSNGKTTVKEMLSAILSRSEPVLATRGNYNNEIGLPLTLCRLDSRHHFAVVEMGASREGDIAYLCGIARPDVGLVTNAGPAHLDGFGGLDGVARGKGELFSSLPEAGTGIVNRDDAYYELWASMLGGRRRLTFGLSSEAQVRGEESGNGMTVTMPEAAFELTMQVPGRHNRLNALAAAACALALDIDPDQIREGLAAFNSLPGRLQRLSAPGGWTVIDDTYNANPASLYAGLSVLAEESGEAWLVLGDMAELGADAGKLHAEVGQTARDLGVTRLLATGRHALASVQAFGEGGEHFPSRTELESRLTSHIHPGVRCLVKGSRCMGMEQVVAALMKEQAA